MVPEKEFAKAVVSAGKVWTLASDKGWAVSESVDYEDAEALPFWSDREKAATAAAGEWAGYQPEPVPLDVFLEEWLPGMHFDLTLAGINWGADRKGPETEPLKLAQEVIAALKAAEATVKFSSYSSLEEYEKEVKQALNG